MGRTEEVAIALAAEHGARGKKKRRKEMTCRAHASVRGKMSCSIGNFGYTEIYSPPCGPNVVGDV